jgi:thioesterase domain-containing protein/acyl carrier protein
MISSSSSDGLQGISRDELYALYERIALDLNEPTEILRAIDAHARRSTAAGIDRAPFVAPRTDGERQMLDIWRNVLNVDSLSIKDDYFKLGGTSVMAVRLVLEIERVFNRRLEIATLLQAPTVESLTRELHKTVVDDSLAMVALRPGSAHAPLFLLPGVGGHSMSFRELARLVTIENAIYAMEMRPELEHNRRPRSMEHIAAEFIGRISAVTPFGPILLAGWSFGGALAFEVAQQLTAAGREVAIVLLFDTYGPGFPRALPTRQRILAHASNLLRLSSAQRLQYIVSRFRSTCRLIRHQWRKLSGWREVDFIAEEDPNLREMVAHSEAAWAGYCPKPLPVRLTLIRAQHHDSRVGITYDDPYNGWGPFAADGIDVYPVDAAHLTLFEPPAVAAVAAALTKCVLTACQQCPTSG